MSIKNWNTALPLPTLIPEFAVTDWQKSKTFYCDLLGFELDYERAEEGFAMLALGPARLMIDQIGKGRTFDDGHLPKDYPFGRGLNVQLEVPDLNVVLRRLERAGLTLYLPLEEKWYRRNDSEVGNRQCVIADPDGYLLRLFEDLGAR